ncbi:hypothetical protein AVEN_86527-1 [Araneus ventricosus]|uniref:Uncharacterized protein n=1 Tax=Araneus ventricosus TaxID=182803 RepID=A0A4Y2NIS4_ARAVE|nr:hypothetical protein AVEN_86527-1 [Araneus ventricosus]
MPQPLPKEVCTISDGGTQNPTINIPPGEASARFLIRVLAVTPRRKQAEVNNTTPLNEVSDLNKEMNDLASLPAKVKIILCSWEDTKNEQVKQKKA